MQDINTLPAILQTVTPATQTPEAIVDLFLRSLDIRQNSKKLYRQTIGYYLDYVSSQGLELSQLTQPDLIRYRDTLLASGKSTLTVSSYITAIKSFYEWVEAMRIYPNIAKGLRSPKRRQQFSKQPLTPTQATTLLNSLEASSSLKDYAIVNLLLRTGLRTIEVIRANVGDIQQRGGKRILLVHGKGRDEKDNFVVLTDKAAAPLQAYLATRPQQPDSAPLFVSTSNNSKGLRLNTRTIRGIVKDNLRKIGLDSKALSAHSLRHTGATNILRETGDLEKTRIFCRHSNPATTLIYTATLAEENRLKASGEDVLDRLF